MTPPVCCTTCGIDQLPDSTFCHGCGQPLSGGRALPAADGEHKRITVLFIDAFGSIGLDNRLDAEQWHEIMESFFSVISTAVQHYGGTIDRLTGEGIKILFGAPAALERHATHACHAALHIRDRLREFAEAFRTQADVDLAARMGINSGEVVFGRVGATGNVSFTSQGHTAALAARMQQLAEPGSIYLTEDTAALVADYFELRELGELQMRNANRRMRAFELVAAREDRSRLDVARDRGLSPFLGRDAELATLERHLETIGRSETRVIGIVGEPGIGKSRLVEEFLARQAGHGYWTQVTRCSEHARWIPFHASVPYVRRLFDVSEQDDTVTTRDRITRAILAVDPALAESLPILFTVMGVADPEETARATGSTAPTREIAHVMRRFIEHAGDGRPVIFVTDDQQWMDGGSDGVFGDLVLDPPRSACLVIVTYRRGHRRRWMRDGRFREIALRPLSEEAMSTLVRSLVGDDPSLGDLPRRILARAGGNPYFVEELVRSLVDNGALTGEPGQYRLARPDVQVTVPGSLHAVLAARVDQLEERAKSVLQTAAVIGREFPVELLGKLVDETEEDLARLVNDLEAADFLHGFGWGDRAMYAFRHPLLRETVYRSLLGDNRRRIHAAIVRELSARPDAQRGLGAALIAPHAEAADDPVGAARWHAMAARHTAEWDPVQGLEQWRRVLANTNGIELDHELARLRLAACEAIVRLGFHQALPIDETNALLEEGDALAARVGDARTSVFLTSARGNLRSSLGDADGALAFHGAAYARARRDGDEEASLLLAARLVLSERMAGRLHAALQHADEALEAVRDTAVKQSVTIARHHVELARIIVLFDLGRAEAAAAELGAVITALRTGQRPGELAWALAATVLQMRHTGDVSPLLAGRVEEARVIAQQIGVPGLLAYSAAALSMVRIMQRRWDEARGLAIEALDVPVDLGHPFYSGLNPKLQLSYAHFGLGEPDRALAFAERALDRAFRRGSVIGQMDALFQYGRLLRHRGDDASVASSRRVLLYGLVMARRVGARPRVPLFLMELVGVARRAGNERLAQACKRRAVREFLRVDAVGFVRRLAEGPPRRPPQA